MGGTKETVTTVQQPAQPPAPSATESARSIYEARAQYDPLLAQQQFDIQQANMPKQTALETALMMQYGPQLAQAYTDVQKQQMPQLQALQAQLYPQQSQVIEAGAGRALQQLQSPFGYTPDEESALQSIRDRQRQELSRQLRTQANLGGGLYGGRAGNREEQAQTQLSQGFAQEDINRRLQAGQSAQQAAIPYMQILYPQVSMPNAPVSPFQYQSATPSPDSLYNAMYGASRQNYDTFYQPSQPSPVWGLAGQALGAGAMYAGLKR